MKVPECFVCGSPCRDAGDDGRLELRPVPTKGGTRRRQRPTVHRKVRVCGNCRDDDSNGGN